MNQLSLNLVTISVFLFTMSALLGPVVHLSPAVPATAVAGLLLLAAFDTLGWQGQGSLLLLDWLAGFSAEHRDRILRHEAGHFLVAHLLEIPVTGYSLSPWEALKQGQPGQGGVQFATQALEAELQQGKLSAQLVDRYCAVWMAGMAAEALAYGSCEGGASDRQMLQTTLAQLQLQPQIRQQKERLAALRAKTLLQEHQPAYEALVMAMQERRSVTECSEMIQQNLAPEKA